MFLRNRVTIVSGRVGPAAGLLKQRFPLVVGQAAALPVSPRVFAPVVEEADIVVFVLERLDFTLNEIIKYAEIVLQFFGYVEVHVCL